MQLNFLSLFIGIFFIIQTNAQENASFLNENPLTFSYYNFTEEEITYKIRHNQETSYKDIDIQELRMQIWDHNVSIDAAQQKLTEKQNLLIDKRQELLTLENISQISERINAKMESIERIHKDVETNLKNLGYKGVYLFACKLNSAWIENKTMKDLAMNYITPLAVESTNGSFISSITELKRKEGFDDEFYRYIRDEVKGTCNIEAEILNSLNRKDAYYILLVKVNTKPLQNEVYVEQSNSYGIPENSLIINAIKDSRKISQLNSIDVPKSEIKQIEEKIKHWEELIETENQRINEIERNFILTGDKKIQRIYSEVLSLEKEMQKKQTHLKSLLNNYTNTKFDSTNLDITIENGISDIDNQIKALHNQIIELESQRIFAKYQVIVTTAGNYFREIAKESITIKNDLLETYSKVENYQRIAEMENDYYMKFVGSDINYTRELDKLWIFPEPGDGDYFKITLVTKFNVKQKNDNYWNY
jgi:hypothetical protein